MKANRKPIRIFILLALAFCSVGYDHRIGAQIAAQIAAAKPSPRRGHCLVYDEQNARVILLDGYQQPDLPEFGDVWSWDGKKWKLIPGSGPTSRTLRAAAFDSRRKKLVLFGGVGAMRGYDDLDGTTWTWDGRSWLRMKDTGTGTRDHHAMVYDAARGKIVMYGGQDSARSWVNDTWEWDGATWKQFSVPGPGGRAHFSLAYDSRRKKTVLFGGSGEGNKIYNDTWTWDGRRWQKVSDEGPRSRARHRMAFDREAGVIILYGGGAAGEEFGDTWMWDGRKWTEIKVIGPGKRRLHAMAYDAKRRKIVLHGGMESDKALGDLWEWDGKGWSKRAD